MSLHQLKPLKSLDEYLNVIEDDVDSAILFTNGVTSGRARGLMSSLGDCWIRNNQCHTVECSEPHSEGGNCGTCDIMDYAEIHQLPLVLFFRKRVLKGQLIGLEPDIIEQISQAKDCVNRVNKHRRCLGTRANNLVFHIMNVMTLGSISACLRILWHAQGINVVTRRTMKHPRKSWKECLKYKKDGWRATGIMATLLVAAAAALLGITDHPTPRLLCLASIVCDLGSAIAATTLLCCFEDDRALRLAWFEGGAFFLLALSGPSSWLRWGLLTLLSALLAFIWLSQPMAAKVLGTLLVAIQCTLFFVLPFLGQAFRFWGAVELFGDALPLGPEFASSYPPNEQGAGQVNKYVLPPDEQRATMSVHANSGVSPSDRGSLRAQEEGVAKRL